MPPSRIVFALGDLGEEVKRLSPPDSILSISICLDSESYDLVRREVIHHYGAQLKTDFTPVGSAPGGPYLEHFKLGGLRIGRIVDKNG